MKVAFVCEDPTNDQYIVRPVLQALLADLGRPRARVFPVTNPRTTGFDSLLAHACEILDRYSQQAAAVIFVIDLDCDDGSPGRRNKPQRLRNALSQCAGTLNTVSVAAVQEVEVWALWGVRNELADSWTEVRAQCDPKDIYFEGQITKADGLTPDGGRRRLVESALASGWRSIAGACPELADLREELAQLI